jgi:hypothetical protein
MSQENLNKTFSGTGFAASHQQFLTYSGFIDGNNKDDTSNLKNNRTVLYTRGANGNLVFNQNDSKTYTDDPQWQAMAIMNQKMQMSNSMTQSFNQSGILYEEGSRFHNQKLFA